MGVWRRSSTPSGDGSRRGWCGPGTSTGSRWRPRWPAAPTPSSPSRSPARCSSASARRRRGSRSCSTSSSTWRRSPCWRRSSDRPSTTSGSATAGSSAILFALRAGVRDGAGVHAARPRAVLLRPRPARRGQGVRRRPPGARARARRRARPARRRQRPPRPPQRDRRRRSAAPSAASCSPRPDRPAVTLALACVTFGVAGGDLAAAAVDHPARGPHAERRVRGAARADDRRHVVGVHGDPRRRSASSCSGWPSPCAARASRRGCTARPSPPTASARSSATPSPRCCGGASARIASPPAPSPRSPSSSPSAPSDRRGRSCCWCRSCSAGWPPSPARASTRWSRPTPRWPPAAARSPASRPASSSAGWPARWRRRRSPSRSATASTSSPCLLLPSAWWYVSALRAGQIAHVEDPYDPLEVARRRVDHAVEWHRRDLDRLAVTELAGVVDLARASGVELTPSAIVRLDALRAAALSTWPLDSREVDWAMAYATSLVGRLDPGRRPPATNGDEPADVVARRSTVDAPTGSPAISRRSATATTTSPSTATSRGRSSARPVDQSSSER